jgi:hypothetical protein
MGRQQHGSGGDIFGLNSGYAKPKLKAHGSENMTFISQGYAHLCGLAGQKMTNCTETLNGASAIASDGVVAMLSNSI